MKPLNKVTRWNELTEEQKKRLQKPRHQLTREEKECRKRLFWNNYWIDAYGNKHQMQSRREMGK